MRLCRPYCFALFYVPWGEDYYAGFQQLENEMLMRRGKARLIELVSKYCAAALFATIAGLGVSTPPVMAQVMMLPGQFDVSPTGAALYTVPIEVPPGTGGMSPALTLDYSSDGGNGLLGVGWNLGGLPSIGRCPKTVAQDSVHGRIYFNTNDRFCMDGQRLIVTSGTYGAANSEYRTEIEGFTKVVAYGAAGNGPAYFKVWTKSGQIMEFGNTTDSRILAQGTTTARSWAANKISDTKGNYLTITYTNDTTNGQAYPTRIDYTGNASASLAPYNSVRFEYEARPDINPLYIAGSMIKNTVRLKKIKTYEGASTVVKVYELSYDASSSTSRSRVTSIKMCDGTGTNCMPATTFSMSTASLTFPQNSLNPVATGNMGSSVVLYIGDWNGDGVTDAMTWNPFNGTNKWFVNDGALGFTTYTNPITTSQITGASTELYIGDWNGDAITDVMWRNQANGTNRWFTNNGAVSFTQSNDPILTSSLKDGEIYFGDWNGDAITDVMWRSLYLNNGTNRWFTNDGALSFSQTNNLVSTMRTYQEFQGGELYDRFQQADEVNFVDGNGDGITDVMVYYAPLTSPAPGEDCDWYINGGAPSFTLKSSNLCIANLNYGDWNGDGLADALAYSPSIGSTGFWVNDGNLGFSVTVNPISNSTITGNWILSIGDWNADGLSDVMFHLPSAGTNRWFETSWDSNGALQFSYTSNVITPSQVTGTGGVLTFGDWNGDGFNDPLFRLPSAGTNRWFYKNGTMRPDVLTTATTGLGAPTDIFYKPLTQSSVYAKDVTATYPVIDIKVPYYVVSRVDAANGVGGYYSSSYAYVGAKLDVSGRGFLGFRQQVVTDLQTSVAQTLTFRQDYPFIGFVSEDKKVRSGVTLNDRDNTYAATNLGGTRRFPYLSQSVEASTDLNGTAFPAVTSAYTYDGYGNPLTIAVSTPDGANRTTTNTYSNNTASWILGRLLTATVASTTPDVTPTPTGCQTNCIETISFSVDDATVTQGDTAVFTVTKSGNASQSYTVDYATADGTATAGADYTAANGTLTFLTSDATKTVSIITASGGVVSSEDFYVNLSNASAISTISQAQGTGVINEFAPVSFTISDASVAEGGALIFTVTKTGATTLTHAVSYASADGTATAGSDYTAVSGSLSFAPGETSKTISISTGNDTTYENNETVIVNLTAPTNGATLADGQATGTITNNDAGPSFSVDDVSISEGGTLSFTVTKAGATTQSHNVNYATANNTAVASDYTAKSGTLSFTAAQTTKTVSVATTVDSVYENNEILRLNLSSPTNGSTISDNQGNGTINNNDAAPSFKIGNRTRVEGQNLSFTITKTGLTAKNHTISFATANNSATAGSDYVARTGARTFSSGVTTKTVLITGIQDSVVEPTEKFYVNLSNPTGGATITDAQGNGYITNDDVSNAAPNAVNDTFYNVNKTAWTTLNVRGNDSDPDGDAFTITSASGASGQLQIINGATQVRYQCPTGCNTDDSFSYTISDGSLTDTASVILFLTTGGGGLPLF
jgi:Calx-beta domain/Salmonella virulence plasmid 65kDa B protein/Bacterial Ig domain/Insecticide toxin TcdB middle/N-terminal region/FG-GAP-like repeat